jgi:DNA-binding response OmpR family regulator
LEDRPTILVIDRNRTNFELLSRVLDQRGYNSLSSTTMDDLDKALEDVTSISLALIDLGGFDNAIWSRCDTMRQASIPFLIISPQQLTAVQRTGLQVGARGVVVKPLIADDLMGIIDAILEY